MSVLIGVITSQFRVRRRRVISGLPAFCLRTCHHRRRTVGENAARIVSVGAVTILDNRQNGSAFSTNCSRNVSTLISSPANIEQSLKSADIIIGAVLIPGSKAPRLITRK